ncbi:MAG: choice-of-anchor D domain-containing protein [Acidobacteriia bacterium]|nr:choice-of-anchor D domain-containing protein [Terriglobia bacterium]
MAPPAYADQGSFTNSGGSTSVGSGVFITSSVASPAGTLTLDCPATGTGICAGGSFSFAADDGTVAINASFSSGAFGEACAGGGKGGHVTCYYTFSGNISGTLTANGSTQAIVGVTRQVFGTGGAAASGTTAYNAAYTPFYYSDTEQILRSDDLQGTNQISFGTQGSGVGEFYGAYGIALDAAGRIYVADTYNCRIVRIDDMIGTNWTEYGTCGSDPGQFYDPSGIAIDAAGRIYVMDTGNSRIVRMDDMTGTNWVSYGSAGSGVGQFAPYISSVAVDSAARIYVADTGNARLVRFDDFDGTNWTELTQSPPVNGISYYSFQSPAAVTVDAAGRIYVADNEYYQPAIVRVDDMTGANWTAIYTGATSGLNSVSIDAFGSVLAGGGGARIVDDMAAVLPSSGAIGPVGSYYVFGVTAIPLPTPIPSAISFSPDTLDFSQNVGTSSSQSMTVANFGGGPLNLGTISASGDFSVDSSGCPRTLDAGTSCTISVTFAPSSTGAIDGALIVTDDSGNLGAMQAVTLTGTGTAPVASVTPASLTFSSQVLGTTSGTKSVVLQNIGTGPMHVASVTATSPFTQTNTCSGSIVPGASCTISVAFTPTALGAASGTITIVDDAGTQTVTLAGTGSAPVTFSSSSLNFGTVAIGNTSAIKSVTVTNRLNVPLSFASIVASSGFAIASTTCGAGIAAGANCSVGVTFTPSAIGSAAGTLTFTDSALTSPQTVSLSGTGSAPVTFSSTSLSFGTVAIGNTSSVKSVTVTNRQNVALTFASIATSAGFAVASSTCGAGIAAGGSCAVGVTFSPTAIGSATGTLTFTDSAMTSPQTVNLSGTGSAPVTFSSSSLNFGYVTVGTTSSIKSVTLTNRGNVPLSFASIVASASFAIASSTCGASIAAGASCSVGVTFSPTATGAVTGALTFTDDAATSPQTVGLTGTGK